MQIMREKRMSARLTQGELAYRVGVDRTTISKIERGVRPSVETAQKIGQCLGFNWTLFFEKKDMPGPP